MKVEGCRHAGGGWKKKNPLALHVQLNYCSFACSWFKDQSSPPVHNFDTTLQKVKYPKRILVFFLLPSFLSFHFYKTSNFSALQLFFSSNCKVKADGRQQRRGEKMGRCPPDWSSSSSLAEILRVHLSCHLHCNCPLFCHLDYIHQGHANEVELKIGCLKVRST